MQDQTNQKAAKFVIIVEDDKFYGNIYKTKLAKAKFEAVVAGNGEEAIEMARKRKPDLILLDLVMPIKDGFQTLKELKADSNLKDVKVVVLSNLSQQEDVKKAKELGASDYLVKTNMSIKEVMDKIQKYLA